MIGKVFRRGKAELIRGYRFSVDLVKRTGILRRLKIAVEDVHIAAAKCRRIEKKRPGKPLIMVLCDVKGWAWDYKAQQLKKYLSDEFEIDILYWSDFKWRDVGTYLYHWDHDLYFTFECNFVPYLSALDPRRLLTGVTSHTYVNFENYQRSLKSAYAVHANSRLLFDEIRKINSRCFYVPNGVDETRFPFAERDLKQPFTAGYVGKKTKRKGYEDYVVPACDKAGVPLKSITSKYNHPDKIAHEEMADFYRGVDVVLVASDMDGTPNQLLEAASVGRTFVGNAIGNVPEFIENGRNGFLVPRDVETYAEKLVWLKENRDQSAEMGRAARRTVENGWTWKIQAEHYRTMFRQTLKGI